MSTTNALQTTDTNTIGAQCRDSSQHPWTFVVDNTPNLAVEQHMILAEEMNVYVESELEPHSFRER
jgi:hypothetical protein